MSVLTSLSETDQPEPDQRVVDDEALSAWLIADGRLRDADLGRGRRLARSEGLDLMAVLLRLGVITERDRAEALARWGPGVSGRRTISRT